MRIINLFKKLLNDNKNKNKNKNIYGTVTPEEKSELEEEGIELANIPWLNKKEN